MRMLKVLGLDRTAGEILGLFSIEKYFWRCSNNIGDDQCQSMQQLFAVNIIDFVTIFTKNILTTGKSSSYCIAYPNKDTSNLFVAGA